MNGTGRGGENDFFDGSVHDDSIKSLKRYRQETMILLMVQ